MLQIRLLSASTLCFGSFHYPNFIFSPNHYHPFGPCNASFIFPHSVCRSPKKNWALPFGYPDRYPRLHSNDYWRLYIDKASHRPGRKTA